MTRRRDIDAVRNLSGDIWNVAVDEHQGGFLKRRDLLRYAALLGLTGFAASQGLGGARASQPLRGGKAGQAEQCGISEEIAALEKAALMFVDGDIPDVPRQIANCVDISASGHFETLL